MVAAVVAVAIVAIVAITAVTATETVRIRQKTEMGIEADALLA